MSLAVQTARYYFETGNSWQVDQATYAPLWLWSRYTLGPSPGSHQSTSLVASASCVPRGYTTRAQPCLKMWMGSPFDLVQASGDVVSAGGCGDTYRQSTHKVGGSSRHPSRPTYLEAVAAASEQPTVRRRRWFIKKKMYSHSHPKARGRGGGGGGGGQGGSGLGDVKVSQGCRLQCEVKEGQTGPWALQSRHERRSTLGTPLGTPLGPPH